MRAAIESPTWGTQGSPFDSEVSLSPRGKVIDAGYGERAGRGFSLELAVQVLDTPPLHITQGWEELLAAQLVRDHWFTHDFLYEAVLQHLPAPVGVWRRWTARPAPSPLAKSQGDREPCSQTVRWGVIERGCPVGSWPPTSSVWPEGSGVTVIPQGSSAGR